MAGTDGGHALDIAGQFSAAIGHRKIEHQTSKISDYLTISAGLVSTIPQKGDSPFQLLRHADELLYEARAMGRNQIRSE